MNWIENYEEARKHYKDTYLFLRDTKKNTELPYYIREIDPATKVVYASRPDYPQIIWPNETDNIELIKYKINYGLYNCKTDVYGHRHTVLLSKKAEKNYHRGFNRYNVQIQSVLKDFYNGALGTDFWVHPQINFTWLEGVYTSTYPETIDEAIKELEGTDAPCVALNKVFAISFNPILDYGRYCLWKYDRPIGLITDSEILLSSNVFNQEIKDLLRKGKSTLCLNSLRV